MEALPGAQPCCAGRDGTGPNYRKINSLTRFLTISRKCKNLYAVSLRLGVPQPPGEITARESKLGGLGNIGGYMTTKTLTRADLTEAVFAAVGLPRNEASQLVEDILEEVCGALSRGETVKLSSFGTFQVRQKSQRIGRNPKTGDEVPIAPRRVLVFRPSHVLKAQINRDGTMIQVEV